jgi:hypothetical protein
MVFLLSVPEFRLYNFFLVSHPSRKYKVSYAVKCCNLRFWLSFIIKFHIQLNFFGTFIPFKLLVEAVPFITGICSN